MASKVSCPKLRLSTERLTQDGFAPFGTVIDVSELDGEAALSANQGSALKWPGVTQLTSHYDELAPSQVVGKPSVSVFQCKPRELQCEDDLHRDVRAPVDKTDGTDPSTFLVYNT